MTRETLQRSHRVPLGKKRRGRQTRRRRLRAETLETRRVLSANPVGDFSQLTVDPEAFDASSMIVRYRSGDASSAAAENLIGPSRTVDSVAIGFGLNKVVLRAGVSVDTMIESYARNPDVLYAEPDYTVRVTSTIPDDPRFGDQWDMHNVGQSGGVIDADIDAPEAWTEFTGTGSTLVAVIDTGVEYTHPDLAPNIWTNPGEIAGDGIDNDNNGFVDDVHGYDFYNDDGDPMDDHNHGTHVAGTIGARGDDGVGIAGINWNTRIMAIKFLGADGSGTTSDAIAAIQYAVDNGAHLSNNSWGGDPYSQALYDVIEYARDEGHIFVAASGNGNFIGFGIDNDAEPFYPASYDLDNIVAVGATDRQERLAIFSNYGQTSVDLAAPGVDILSTVTGGGYGLSSGTSMAAPHVTGVLSMVRDHDPGLAYTQIIDQVLLSADPVDELIGRTVTGARLNLANALIPDETGPMVADVSLSDLVLDPFSSLTVRFSEPIDADTVDSDTFMLIGPNGPITIDSMTASSASRQFELNFAEQTDEGVYELTVAADLTDRFGNLIDQNENGTGGEVPGDEHRHSFTKVNAIGRFDFGTSTSAVANYYTQITGGYSYNSFDGYGWEQGAVYSLSRGGQPLTGDFNYTREATFAMDVPNGEYDVLVTMGETIVPHEQMGVLLEGTLVGNVTTAAGEFPVNTYRTSVSDGKLHIGFEDLGGGDPWVVINAIDVVYAGPDLTGPTIVSHDATGTFEGPLDTITVSFSEPIADGSFTVDDILAFNGPGGAIVPTAVVPVSTGEFEIRFDTLNIDGDFALTIGADITDVAGNPLDQDGDGTGGESPDDEYAIAFTLQKGPEFLAGYDFGTISSPVKDGYFQVTGGLRYTETRGYGWDTGYVYSLNRSGDSLTRDINYTKDANFKVDLPNGEYDVTVTLGEVLIGHDQVGVSLEGVQVDVVSTTGGQFAANTYRIGISDGQLDLGLKDLGGSNPWAAINGLDILFVGPDLTGPSVVATNATGEVTGPLESIQVTFSEPVDPATFTLDDIHLLEGPSGAITPTAVLQHGPGAFEITFAPQNVAGDYRVVFGPDVRDLGGNLMDQNGDATPGEPDDAFDSTFTLIAGPDYIAHYDFGTSLSPLEDGYTRVAGNTRYSQASGFGWITGSVYAINRAGTNLQRDLNYTADAVFAMDVENGEYEITVTMGEYLIGHDQMGVYGEGVQLDVITTPAFQYAVNTYSVTVTDGQLSLGIKDLGGSNQWAVINALDIALVELTE